MLSFNEAKYCLCRKAHKDLYAIIQWAGLLRERANFIIFSKMYLFWPGGEG